VANGPNIFQMLLVGVKFWFSDYECIACRMRFVSEKTASEEWRRSYTWLVYRNSDKR